MKAFMVKSSQTKPFVMKSPVLWTSDDVFAGHLLDAGRAAGLSLIRLPANGGACPAVGPDEVVFVDGALGMDSLARLAAGMPASQIVYCFGGSRREMISDLIGKLGARHVLGRNQHILTHEIYPLVALCDGSGDTWSRVSSGSTVALSTRLWDGSAIAGCVDEVRKAASVLNTYSEFPNYVATCAWELLTNAVYDARRGTSIELSRDSREALPDSLRTGDRLVSLDVCHDDHKIAVRIADNLGRLTPAMVSQNLARADARSGDQIKGDHGGAGVGLYMVLHESAQLVFSVQKGVSTEIIFTLPVERMNRSFLTRAPSVHFFEMGS